MYKKEPSYFLVGGTLTINDAVTRVGKFDWHGGIVKDKGRTILGTKITAMENVPTAWLFRDQLSYTLIKKRTKNKDRNLWIWTKTGSFPSSIPLSLRNRIKKCRQPQVNLWLKKVIISHCGRCWYLNCTEVVYNIDFSKSFILSWLFTFVREKINMLEIQIILFNIYI